MQTIKLFAISGSLRKTSLNTAVLKALAELSPVNIEIELFSQMANMPLFNPDFDGLNFEAVKTLKLKLAQADGLIIASPEYAHGISGVMKNTLDWLVAGEEFVDKPVMLINTSPRAQHAQSALIEVISTMSGIIHHPAYVELPLLGFGFNGKDIALKITEIPSLSEPLAKKLDIFYQDLINCPPSK